MLALTLIIDESEFYLQEHETLNDACKFAAQYDNSILTWVEFNDVTMALGKRGEYHVYKQLDEKAVANLQ